MIDVLFEQRIIQNTGLAAEAIWQAVHEASRAEQKSKDALVTLDRKRKRDQRIDRHCLLF